VAVIAGLADTSVFIASESGRQIDTTRLPAILRVSVITIGELRQGVLGASDAEVRSRRLDTLTRASSLEPIPVSEPVAEAWALMRVRLHATGRSMPVNDSWIAATAIALGIPLVTQDDDYLDAPGLEVIRV
jgi:predicted nucleic acid-binding protein